MRYYLLLLALFIIPIVYAETVTTNINATYVNGTNAVQINGETTSTIISCSNGSYVNMPVTFNRDITCTSVGCDNQLNNLTKYLTFYWSNYSVVQEKWMECNASHERMIGIEKSCNDNLNKETNTSSDYRQRYDNCNTQYSSCVSSKGISETNYNNCVENNKNNTVYCVLCLIVGAGGMYLIKKKPEGKTPTEGMQRR